MGHTVNSQRMMQDRVLSELRSYGKALREDDRLLLEIVLQRSYRHYGAVSYASSLHVWAFLLTSICLEQEKEIKELRRLYESVANGRISSKESSRVLVKNT